MQILLSFTNPHVISNLYDFISSVEYKNIFRKLFNVSVGSVLRTCVGKKHSLNSFVLNRKQKALEWQKGE